MKKYLMLTFSIMMILMFSYTVSANPYPSSQTFLYNGSWYETVPCTYAAWQLAYDRLGISLGMWGNGGDWLVNAQNSGWRGGTGTTAKANSLAVYNGATEWGHVAYVSSVEGNTMTLIEGGIPGYGYNTRTQSGWSTVIGSAKYSGGDYLRGFIYLDGGQDPYIRRLTCEGRDANGFMIRCEVDEDSNISEVELATWDDVIGNNPATWQKMVHMDKNVYKLYVGYSLFHSNSSIYYNDVYVRTYSGAEISGDIIGVAKPGVLPSITSVRVIGKDSGGYMAECIVDNDYLVDTIRIATWTDGGGGTAEAVWNPMVKMDQNTFRYYVHYDDHRSSSNIFYNDIYITTYNDEEVKYSMLTHYKNAPTATPAPTSTPIPTVTPTATPTVSPTMSPTVTPTPTVTQTPEPTATPTPEPQVTSTPTPTPEALVTSTPTPTPSPTPKPTVTPTETPAVTPTPTKAPEKALSVGSTFKKQGLVYKVKKGSTVECAKPTSKTLTKVTIPDTVTVGNKKYKVTSIGANAFSGNKKLTTVKIGKYVMIVGNNAFANCAKLKNVTIGAAVTTIGNKAFFKCTSLQKLVIPASVKKIGQQVFYGDKKLTQITVKGSSISSVGKNAFSGVPAKAKVKVPKKKAAKYKKLFQAAGMNKKITVY